MNYELAKNLKDAGFPNSQNWYDDGNTMWGGIEMEPPAPTLSELIEACGERFEGLRRCEDPDIVTNYIWGAYAYLEGRTDASFEASGKTSEEAVAKLWLALNGK